MRSRRGTFSGEGQLLNFEDEPTIEGFVMMKGVHQNSQCLHTYHINTTGSNRDSWKQRWVIINNDTFLFFKNKQVHIMLYALHIHSLLTVCFIGCA